jgi:hypothetical protein
VLKTNIEQLQQLSGCKKSNNVENAQKSKSQSEKGTESQKYFRKQIEQFEPI